MDVFFLQKSCLIIMTRIIILLLGIKSLTAFKNWFHREVRLLYVAFCPFKCSVIRVLTSAVMKVMKPGWFFFCTSLQQKQIAACFRLIVFGSAELDRKHECSERVTVRVWLRDLHLPVQLGNADLPRDQRWLCQKKVRRQGNVNVEKSARKPQIMSLAYASLLLCSIPQCTVRRSRSLTASRGPTRTPWRCIPSGWFSRPSQLLSTRFVLTK